MKGRLDSTQFELHFWLTKREVEILQSLGSINSFELERLSNVPHSAEEWTAIRVAISELCGEALKSTVTVAGAGETRINPTTTREELDATD